MVTRPVRHRNINVQQWSHIPENKFNNQTKQCRQQSAERANTNYKRLREYVKQHPDCKTYQKDIRNTKLEERDNLLIDSAPEAVKTLRDIMRDPRNRAYTRIEAARTILSENRSSVSEVDIKEAIEFQEERINALEGRRIIDVEAN